ncbi:MAG: EF-P lysine aminoacylase GenX [Marinobacter sp.]|nr:EF-P lysine aminoacylase GenX [Marinobacter sp.]
MMQPDWQPTASLQALKNRAELLQFVRGFFASRQVMEVETPVLARHGVSDLHLDAITARTAAGIGFPDGRAYLQTSPEYHMKRLLAAGSGPIFQVFRAFRDGELGRRHNPEFTLLEWYRPGFADDDLMTEVGDLVAGWLGLNAPPQRISYRQALQRWAGLDPFLASDAELRVVCESWLDKALADTLSRDICLDVIMSHQVEPALAKEPPTFICLYPASQAALAKTSIVEGQAMAHRFELYVRGVELCNGYWELTDAAEQARRFELDNQLRAEAGKPVMAADAFLLAALNAGMPASAGVALGLDRLLMVSSGADSIADVMAFPAPRA